MALLTLLSGCPFTTPACAPNYVAPIDWLAVSECAATLLVLAIVAVLYYHLVGRLARRLDAEDMDAEDMTSTRAEQKVPPTPPA